MNQFRLLLTAVLVLVVGAGASAQQKYSLAYKFEKGKTYRYHMESKGVSTQEMMGREMKVDNASDMVVKMVGEDVLSSKDAVLIVSAESATTTVKSPMKDTTMVLSQLIGKRSKFVVSPKGKILNREVIDSIKMEGVRSMGAREMMKTHELPAEPVSAGATWKAAWTDTMEAMGGKLITTYANEYTLAGTQTVGKHDCVTITFTGKITITGSGKMMGMEFFMEGSGTSKGVRCFDAAAGLAISDEADTNIDMTMAATGQQNMTIPMTQTAKSKQTLME
jgi:hypothetical protein